jgi:co-chaperonin GroES (HSP10)
MLGDWVFLEPAYEDEASITSPSGLILKSAPDLIPNVATIRHLPKSVDTFGLQEGDKVHYTKESHYDINVEGKVYFRMKVEDILGVYENVT